MIKAPEKYTVAIVVVGSFNPTIIQPLWLSNKKLRRDYESDKAKIDVIHNEITQFSLEWVRFSITPNRFEATCSSQAYFEPTRDLVVSIFSILKETPITAFGINHLMDFIIRDENEYLHVGNALAPLSNWDKALKDPRLMSIEIMDRKRDDNFNGYHHVKISPSDYSTKGKYAINVNINDHYDLNSSAYLGKSDPLNLNSSLHSQWQVSFSKTQKILTELWRQLAI